MAGEAMTQAGVNGEGGTGTVSESSAAGFTAES
jgi:hypothetical protein